MVTFGESKLNIKLMLFAKRTWRTAGRRLTSCAWFLLIMAMLGLGACSASGPQLSADNVDEVVAAMTLEEKADLSVGIGSFWYYQGQGIAGAAGGVGGNERLGWPPSYLADGPSGLRIYKGWPGTDIHVTSTAFPSSILLASSWDVEAARRMGEAIGVECRENAVASILAPAINIIRHPLGGRTAEYFSEDPLLTGSLAVAYTQGAQSQGIGTSVKHFAVNSQETARKLNDARVSERALREIYLRGFEMAVKEAQPWTIMSSYNKVNGVSASENEWLLQDILRDEWGFQGLVMTDWDAGFDGARQAAAGNDLCQPGHESQRDRIIEAVKSGELPEAKLDRNVRRILQYILKTIDYRQYPSSGMVDAEAHSSLARSIAAEGMVLLRNERRALPLRPAVSVGIYGNAAYRPEAGETGIPDGMKASGFQVDNALAAAYEAHLAQDTTQQGQVYEVGGMVFTNFQKDSSWPELSLSADEWRQQAAGHDCALIVISQGARESSDNEPEDFLLSPSEQELIRQTCTAYHRAGKTVTVVLDVAVPIETASWRNLPDAIVCAWHGGQEKGNAVADVLSGAVNPSGKLTVTFPIRLSDTPAYANFPTHVDYDWQWMQIGFMPDTAGDRLNDKPVRGVHYTDYEEGIYVGYRHYDTRHIPVAYPFGYGLSYTTFKYSDAKVEVSDGGFTATVKVTNSGKVAGREVVQLYVAAPTGGTLDVPTKELRGFAKTRQLQPGESETLTITFTPYQLSSFDEQSHSWIAPAGTYTALFAASAADIRSRVNFELAESFCEDVHSNKLNF